MVNLFGPGLRLRPRWCHRRRCRLVQHSAKACFRCRICLAVIARTGWRSTPCSCSGRTSPRPSCYTCTWYLSLVWSQQKFLRRFVWCRPFDGGARALWTILRRWTPSAARSSWACQRQSPWSGPGRVPAARHRSPSSSTTSEIVSLCLLARDRRDHRRSGTPCQREHAFLCCASVFSCQRRRLACSRPWYHQSSPNRYGAALGAFFACKYVKGSVTDYVIVVK